MNNNVQPPPNAPAFNPNLGRGQFTGYTAAQTAVIVAVVVAAVAATIFAAIFTGVFAIAVVAAAAVAITILALSFRATVIANNTYYLHNPLATPVTYYFAPPHYVRNWYWTNRPQIIHAAPSRIPLRSNRTVDLSGGRQIPGSSWTTSAVPSDRGTPARAVPAHSYRTPDRGTPARAVPLSDRGTPARAVPSFDRGTPARAVPPSDRGTSARMSSSSDRGTSARANAPATRSAPGVGDRVQVGGGRR